MSHSEYRPEIDGLRAIAVVSVVLFHAGLSALGGGYVGVDVFFVLSGFLITGILLRALKADVFSIAQFYERRIRRIYPALFVVLAAAAAAAIALMLADELEGFGRSLLATSLFFANYHFMSDIGYFAAPADGKPLLHMWSLAVEEQFYLVFPLFMALAWRRSPRRLLPATVLLALLSLGYSLWLMSRSPDQAFYSAPARAWELLVGATLAIALQQGALPVPGVRTASVLSALGFLGVLGPIVAYTEATPFPGVTALPPVLGTAALLYATLQPGCPATRWLSARPMRAVGLISYSLYLWHWPVFVFYKVWRIGPISAWESAGLVALAVALAAASYRWVETPFRRGGGAAARRQVLAAGVALMGLGATVGLAAHLGRGFPGRFSPQAQAVLAAQHDAPQQAGCPEVGHVVQGRPVLCALGADAVPSASFVVWGDSHAEALLPALDAAARTRGLRGVAFVRGGCPPLLGVTQTREGFRDCAEGATALLRHLADHPELRVVVLAARWALYAEGRRFRAEPGHRVYLAEVGPGGFAPRPNEEAVSRGLDRTLDALHALGRRVVFVAQVPETEFHVPRAMARALQLGRDVELAPLKAHYEQRQALVDGWLARRQVAQPVLVVRPALRLCAEARCTVARDGRPLYRDTNHITASEARDLAPLFEPALAAP